jgi:putative SOS response-associated peptidase YedK
MCGRFALYTEPVKVARFLQATPDGVRDGWQPSWNIPPTERIVGAREQVDDNGEITRSLEFFRWGLVLFWAKNPSAIKSSFNARAETVATKPMFRHASTTGKRILFPPTPSTSG